MTTAQDIENEINEDLRKFFQTIYDAELPSDILYKFRQALMFHNAHSLQGSPMVIRELLKTREGELKFIHVGIILNTFFSVPFNCMFDSPEEAMNAVDEFKQIEVEYNQKVSAIQKTLAKKKAIKMNLIGGGTNTLRLNGKN